MIVVEVVGFGGWGALFGVLKGGWKRVECVGNWCGSCLDCYQVQYKV